MPRGPHIPGTVTISGCRSWATMAAPRSTPGTTLKQEHFASSARSMASPPLLSPASWNGTTTERCSGSSSRACWTGHRCPHREKKGSIGSASSRRSTVRPSSGKKSRWRRCDRAIPPQHAGSCEVNQTRVTVWNEYRHEREDERYRSVYPDGIHGAIAEGLGASADLTVRTATLDEPDNGLPEDVLMESDVLIWVVAPSHPIATGLDRYIELEREEMYGEFFDIPPPEELVFLSWFPGGEVFRSGCCYTRGSGKIFYFRPGHESYPTFYNADVRKVIANAVRWATPVDGPERVFGNQAPLTGREIAATGEVGSRT